ncbi:hypothetical protein [Anaerosporobacter sp.]
MKGNMQKLWSLLCWSIYLWIVFEVFLHQSQKLCIAGCGSFIEISDCTPGVDTGIFFAHMGNQSEIPETGALQNICRNPAHR